MAADNITSSSTWHTDDTIDVANCDDVAVPTTTVTTAETFISSEPMFLRLKRVAFSQNDTKHLKLMTGNNKT